jgi:hypothetical protein
MLYIKGVIPFINSRQQKERQKEQNNAQNKNTVGFFHVLYLRNFKGAKINKKFFSDFKKCTIFAAIFL